MTAFLANQHYYELTLYMDLFNNEIIAYYLSNKKGNPESYHIAMAKVIEEKNKKYTSLEMILHSDQGSVYCSKRFNESLHLYNIIHSTSKPGPPTEMLFKEVNAIYFHKKIKVAFSLRMLFNMFYQLFLREVFKERK